MTKKEAQIIVRQTKIIIDLLGDLKVHESLLDKLHEAKGRAMALNAIGTEKLGLVPGSDWP